MLFSSPYDTTVKTYIVSFTAEISGTYVTLNLELSYDSEVGVSRFSLLKDQFAHCECATLSTATLIALTSLADAEQT